MLSNNKESAIKIENTNFENIVQNWAKTLTNLAYSYVKDWSLAEDITQESLIKVFKNLHTLKEQNSIKAWLFKITINCCKDYLRSSYFKRTILTNIFNQQSSYNYNLQKEETITLSVQVLSLPIKYREVIIFHYYHDINIYEISEILNVSEGTIKTRLRRGRNKLKKLIEKEI